MSSELARLLPTLLVKDIPRGLFMTMEIDNYEIEVDYRNQETLEIVVQYNESLDRWAMVRILDPDPNLTINVIVKEIQALIEKLVKRKEASTAKLP